MHIYVGNVVDAPEEDYLRIRTEVAVFVDDEGNIQDIKPAGSVDDYPDVPVTHAGPSNFFFPGFIDTHIHAPQLPNVGLFGNTTLLSWLTKYTFPLEAAFANINKAIEVYDDVVSETLSNGTTTASYFATIHVESTTELARIALARGQRAFVGRVCMENGPANLRDEDTATALSRDRIVIEAIEKLDPSRSRVCAVVTPRFALSCTHETLAQLGRLAEERNLPIQTHIAENVNEISMVMSMFPGCKHYADVYDKAGLLKHNTILAHGVHLSDDEVGVIKERGCGISHCPISNAALASGIAPIKKLLACGVKVGLGSDVSGGCSPSILANARQALLVSRLLSERNNESDETLSVATALFLATTGGARLCGRQKLGTFDVGNAWDAQLVNPGIKPFSTWTLTCETREQLQELVSKWVYTGDDRNTVRVWVQGQMVVDKL